jgi:hypothetical protein
MLLIDETVARIRETLPLLASQQITIATREVVATGERRRNCGCPSTYHYVVGAPLTIQVSNKEYIWSSEELARMIEIVQRPATNGSGD